MKANDKNILLIEDNPGDAGLIWEELKTADYKKKNLHWAKCLAEGKEYLEKNPIDLVFLDLTLSDSSGLDTVKAIIQISPNIPIIVLTGNDDKELAIKAVHEGAQDFLIKGQIESDQLNRSILYATERCELNAERMRTQEKLRVYSEELERLNSTKDLFFSIIAHDLRSPFQSLMGMADILIEDIDTMEKEEVTDLLNNLKNSLKMQFELMEKLLSWAQIQRNTMEFSLRRLFLSDKVDGVIDILKIQAVNKNIQLINLVPKELVVYADMNMLQSVFYNLIFNGIKYTNPDGKVEINARQVESSILISVTDNGIGIDENDIERMFRIDTQVTTPGTASEKGTGMGLVLCKELVEKHGGTIWIKSSQGKGTTVYFTLPYKQAKDEAGSKTEEEVKSDVS